MFQETELVSKLKSSRHKERAFATLLDLYQERIYWHIRKIVLTHENANDVLQNTFVRVYRSIEKFEEKSVHFHFGLLKTEIQLVLDEFELMLSKL